MNEELNFPTRMLKACWFTTMRDLGFRTTVTLHNPLPIAGFEAQDFQLSLELFDSEGQPILSDNQMGILGPNGRVTVDVDAILDENSLQGDCVGIVSMTPSTFRGLPNVRITADKISRWTSISDEFIGYTDSETGTKSGVHYQSPPMNDSRLRSTNTMIVQSPKVVLTDAVESHLLIFCPSSNEEFSTPINLKLILVDPSGRVIARGTTAVPARGRRRVRISDLFESETARNRFVEESGFAMLVGLATGGVVAPLSLLADHRGGLAIDHTLPPPYYVPWWGGEARKSATDRLINRLFSDEDEVPV